jgi:hypothetical protein
MLCSLGQNETNNNRNTYGKILFNTSFPVLLSSTNPNHVPVITELRHAFGDASIPATGGRVELMQLLSLGTVGSARVAFVKLFSGCVVHFIAEVQAESKKLRLPFVYCCVQSRRCS